jgi:hypothetical protein
MGHHTFTVDEANEMLSEARAALNQIQGRLSDYSGRPLGLSLLAVR